MKITTITQKYTKYVMVLMAGLLVGGLTMNMVHASVPDGNGTIHGCRSTITTMLRVIDSASASCGSDEASLNWDQSGVKGYATIHYTSSGTFSLDTNHSKNVTNLVAGPINSDGFHESLCLTLATTPHSAALTGDGNVGVSVKDENGWTLDDRCSSVSSTANIAIILNNDTPSFTITLF